MTLVDNTGDLSINQALLSLKNDVDSALVPIQSLVDSQMKDWDYEYNEYLTDKLSDLSYRANTLLAKIWSLQGKVYSE